MPRIRVRFAPSPTGKLHVGNARTALLNWLFARHCGGVFVLRIEDTDRIRTTEAFEENLLEDLKWLGIDWDEGPGAGGAYGPYRQTGRLELYGDCLRRLIADGKVYPCYCIEEELEAERADLVSRRMMPRYLGKCRKLAEGERRRFENEGRLPAWRFRVEEGPIVFDDLIRGSMAFQGEAIGDFIICRSNGIPAYNFAAVVDDHCMEISHVIRGEDHLSNTAMQVLLYRALGFAPPEFAHHSLILGKDHAKLSKRHGAVSVREFRRRGILPEALRNYLALLGSSVEGGREVCSAEELVEGLSLARTGKGGAVFDEEKLFWFNGAHIRRHDPQSLADLLAPFISMAGYDEASFRRERIEAIAATVRDNLTTLADIGGFLELFDDDRYRIDEEAAALLREEEAKTVLLALRKELIRLAEAGENAVGTAPDAASSPFCRGIAGWIRNNETGLKGKKLYLPIRAAVTGHLHGPELDRIFALLGPASLLRRVEKALALS
ncbi:MAG: glutamate--tRNA ligase [Proteobacteria bacterium]|nr:glutamate--tRNA ligase [Pseudomonadota bacterium]MBU2228603.1 glutamate--tRNA ligase [Pseudomonadota bacterium]